MKKLFTTLSLAALICACLTSYSPAQAAHAPKGDCPRNGAVCAQHGQDCDGRHGQDCSRHGQDCDGNHGQNCPQHGQDCDGNHGRQHRGGCRQ